MTLFVIPLLDPVPHTINTMYSIDFETTTAESDSLSGKYGVEIQNHTIVCSLVKFCFNNPLYFNNIKRLSP